MSGEWVVGPIRTATRDGDVIVPGWVNGRFGLDMRVSIDDNGWGVTHLGTGMLVRVLCENLAKTKAFVAEIEKLGDWDFTDPADCKPYGPGVTEALKGLKNTSAVGWSGGSA